MAYGFYIWLKKLECLSLPKIAPIRWKCWQHHIDWVRNVHVRIVACVFEETMPSVMTAQRYNVWSFILSDKMLEISHSLWIFKRILPQVETKIHKLFIPTKFLKEWRLCPYLKGQGRFSINIWCDPLEDQRTVPFFFKSNFTSIVWRINIVYSHLPLVDLKCPWFPCLGNISELHS
jgi:hypothetical protein